jgi:hypothetical protein
MNDHQIIRQRADCSSVERGQRARERERRRGVADALSSVAVGATTAYPVAAGRCDIEARDVRSCHGIVI